MITRVFQSHAAFRLHESVAEKARSQATAIRVRLDRIHQPDGVAEVHQDAFAV